MNQFMEFSDRLISALQLKTPPVAVWFADSPPIGHETPKMTAPAGCKFWELGAVKSLVTNANDHRNCSVGIHTHNLASPPSQQNDELTNTLAAMQGLDYVRPEEVSAIPVNSESHEFVCYAPLSSCEAEPATVLLLASAAQSLILSEALARVDQAAPLSLGRPACAVIPQVINSRQSASSLGCCGARAYLDSFDDNTTLWALNGSALAGYVESIETFAGANRTLGKFHQLRQTDIAAGKTPTVAESLEKLSRA